MTAGNSTCINQTDARNEFVNGIISGGATSISIDEHIGAALYIKPLPDPKTCWSFLIRTKNPKARL